VGRIVGPERAGHIMKSGDPVDAMATTAGDEGVDAARQRSCGVGSYRNYGQMLVPSRRGPHNARKAMG
jgi:hypothetical protein